MSDQNWLRDITQVGARVAFTYVMQDAWERSAPIPLEGWDEHDRSRLEFEERDGTPLNDPAYASPWPEEEEGSP